MFDWTELLMLAGAGLACLGLMAAFVVFCQRV